MTGSAKWLVAVLGVLLAGAGQASDKKTERLYKSKCGACHGVDGKGETEKGKKFHVRDMTTADYQKAPDADFKKAIEEGVKREEKGVKVEMDGYKGELTPEQVDALVKHVRELGAKKP